MVISPAKNKKTLKYTNELKLVVQSSSILKVNANETNICQY